MQDLIGQYLGQYWLAQVIGRGSTSTVYKAYQPALGRYVAVKVLRTSDPTFGLRFHREAQAIAHLQHPNILPIFDYGQDAGVPFFVLPYVENNTTLADLLTDQPMEPVSALQVMQRLLDGLEYAHLRGVIHRDIKPSNILMTSPAWPVLADFGIAKLVDENNQLTPPGQAMGTAIYMAPERAQGQPGDERSDLYSAGVVLFEMLTGRVPFDAKTPLAVLTKHMYEAPPPPRSLNPQLPAPVEQVLLRALEKDPQDRYQSAAEMRTALQQLALVLGSQAVGHLAGGTPPPVVSYETRKLVPDAPPAVLPPRAGVRPTRNLPAPKAPRQRGSGRHALIGGLLGLVTAAVVLLGVAIAANPQRWESPLLGMDRGRATPRITAVAGVIESDETAELSPAQPLAATSDTRDSDTVAAAPASSLPAEPTTVISALPPILTPQAPALVPPPVAPSSTPVPPTPVPPTPVPPTPVPPTPVPEPTSPPPTAPPAMVSEEPPPAPPDGSQTVRLEDTDWQGGYGGAGNRKVYGGRTAAWIYGQPTEYEAMRAVFSVADQPTGTATLIIEGMDSEGPAKTLISIVVNGVEVFRGANPLPNDDLPLETGTWSSATWAFDAAILRSGQNEMVIRNLAPGSFGLPPFFMLDYADVTYPVQ